MASLLSNIKTPLHFHCFKTPFSFRSSLPLIPSLSYHSSNPKLFHSSISSLIAAAAASDSAADSLLEKHVLSQGKEIVEEHCYDEQQQQHNNSEEQGKRVRWKDPILQDSVSLVGFVKMILHSGRYENGEKLSPEHEKVVLEKLLPYHPHYQKKIGTGVDYITIGHHPDFDSTRCMFIVRKDGERVDFSYWKCIMGLVRKNAEKTSRHMLEE